MVSRRRGIGTFFASDFIKIFNKEVNERGEKKQVWVKREEKFLKERRKIEKIVSNDRFSVSPHASSGRA